MFCPFFCWGGLRFKPTNNKKQRDSILKICILRIILGIFFITLYFENFIHVVFGMFLHNFLEFSEIILLNIHFFWYPNTQHSNFSKQKRRSQNFCESSCHPKKKNNARKKTILQPLALDPRSSPLDQKHDPAMTILATKMGSDAMV